MPPPDPTSTPSTPIPAPHPTLDPQLLTNALASLAPALELLERFHHRNKNQHRLSKWWAQADMLRRHVRKMLGELEEGVEEAERAERVRLRRAGKAGKKKRTGGEEGDGVGGGVENEKVMQRAEYLRWRLGPAAFFAFTQLSADRQFAHLGLMLLGVLAQIDKALLSFAPSPSDDSTLLETEDNAGEQTPADGRETPVTGLNSTTPNEEEIRDTDMGEAVSRDAIIHMSIETEQARRTPTLSTPAAPPPPTAAAAATEKLREKEKKRKPSSSRSQSASQTPAAKTEEDEVEPGLAVREKKAKKKEAGGDEFDDIFGSLDDSKSKKPKKKKRKKGDEFDDIFGGLL